jgi:hypothetical protein
MSDIANGSNLKQHEADERAKEATGEVKAQQPQTDEEKEQQKADSQLAAKIGTLIDAALERIKPITDMIDQVIRSKILN